jgi:hypothetical protein
VCSGSRKISLILGHVCPNTNNLGAPKTKDVPFFVEDLWPIIIQYKLSNGCQVITVTDNACIDHISQN